MNLSQTVSEKMQALSPEQQKKILEYVQKLEQETQPRRALSDVMNQIVGETFGRVPKEDLNKLPTDASENLDHYLYGAAKK